MTKIIERVRKAMPRVISRKLWVKAGGRCQYEGCNIPLWKDELTQKDMNKAYISHIIAAKEKGPRGHSILSQKLELAFENLMLLCDECHNRIDKAQVGENTVERLTQMKKEHENRIELVTGLKTEKKTHIVLYGARIGQHQSPLNFPEAVQAIFPERYPVSDRPIEIGMNNCEFEDQSPDYWQFHDKQLQLSFERQVKFLLGSDLKQHFSILALAPQPLLIRLGTLLSDIYHVDVFQRRREPVTWRWNAEAKETLYHLSEPEHRNGDPALIIGLSATVTTDRIQKVLGDTASVWKITIDEPENDFLKGKQQLIDFRKIMRKAFDKIKAVHGSTQLLNIFPAMPSSCAIEVGRVWMPKADMGMVIYDENRKTGGFSEAIRIGHF
jgi:5-methylcytosine-specific restriction endonuclease McrA